MNKIISRIESDLSAMPQSGKWALSPCRSGADVARLLRAMFLSLSVCFLMVVSVFAESYPNRPTAGELDDIVEQGTECACGVNERCWATQYQDDPVQYHVPPLTNAAGFYLDQSLMGTIASKAKSLVSYYVNPDTVYDGTANITMLTVTGVWAELEIGDHTNLFTDTPAIGTNPATYCDYPSKIYIEDLDERYNVLNALAMTDAGCTSYGTNNQLRYAEGTIMDEHNQAAYNELAGIFNATSWSSGINDWAGDYGIGAYLSLDSAPPMDMMRNKGRIVIEGLYATNVAANSYKMFLHVTQLFEYFYDDGYGTNANYYLGSTLPGSAGFPYVTGYFGNNEGALQLKGFSPEDNWRTGWQVDGLHVMTDWKFNFCTD